MSRAIELLDAEVGIDAGYKDKQTGFVYEPTSVKLGLHSPIPASKIRTMLRCEHTLVELSIEPGKFKVGCTRCHVVYEGTW